MAFERGVYYRRADHASIPVRWMACAVDLICFSVMWLAIVAAAAVLGLGGGVMALGMIALTYAYFVALRALVGGTLGYLIFGIRAVGLDGNRARWWPLTVRLAYSVLGPLAWTGEALWLIRNGRGRGLRDYLAGTYVVKAGARPAGSGPVEFRHYHILMVNFLAREVVAEDAVPAMADR
jgi:uncharacterized RDD family membrane protein YckC